MQALPLRFVVRAPHAAWIGTLARGLQLDKPDQRALYRDRVVRPRVQGRKACFAYRHNGTCREAAKRRHLVHQTLERRAELVLWFARHRRVAELGFGGLAELRDDINQCWLQVRFQVDSIDIGFNFVQLSISDAPCCGGCHARLDFLRWALRGGIEIDLPAQTALADMLGISEQFQDLPFDVADASVAEAAARLRIRQLLTIDSDFDVYRDKAGKPLVNVLR